MEQQIVDRLTRLGYIVVTLAPEEVRYEIERVRLQPEIPVQGVYLMGRPDPRGPRGVWHVIDEFALR